MICVVRSWWLHNEVACNDNQLQISEVSQLRDSCVYVTLQYEGHGEYYVIKRVGNNHPVDAMNIIHEGIYLGLYRFGFLLNIDTAKKAYQLSFAVCMKSLSTHFMLL